MKLDVKNQFGESVYTFMMFRSEQTTLDNEL